MEHWTSKGYIEGASRSCKDNVRFRYIPLENILFIRIIVRGKPIQVAKVISMRSLNVNFTRRNFCSRRTFFILSLAKKPIWAFKLYLTGQEQQTISESTKNALSYQKSKTTEYFCIAQPDPTISHPKWEYTWLGWKGKLTLLLSLCNEPALL